MKITDEWWEHQYKPILNKEEDNFLFETNDDSVTKANVDHIWTLVDCDGDLFVIAGRHFVNRLNYLLCEVARTTGIEEEYVFFYEEQYSKNTMIENTIKCILDSFNKRYSLTKEEIEEKVQTYYNSIQL